MKRTLSMLLALVMILSCMSLPAFAEEEAWKQNVVEANKVVVEATDAQAGLETWAKAIIEVDSLKFKDLNSNGALDVYEDWRNDSATRAKDLLSQMTLKEKVGHLFHASTGGTFTAPYPYTEEWLWGNDNIVTINGSTYVPMYHSILTDGVTTYLHNTNGTPETLLYENNTMQLIAESGRLGIPVVLSCDRSYNTFAGMVNLANYALGITHDEELVYDIVAQYAKKERALGFHVPFHSYGVEIGSWYGDEVNYIAKMIATETRAYEEIGVNACTKHFVARGGRTSFIGGVSPANLVDSWMVGWKAAINEGGTSWIMLNNGDFLNNNCDVCYDAESMAYLRDTLGYNSFGGYIDKSHEAFGTANDPELAYKLASYYGKAMDAVGIHVTFEPYANEIGAQYGENPELIASIISAEIRGLQENGLSSCTKHWIGRGGDSAFGKARSVAQNFDNWMEGWTAAIDAGCDWVMTNCGGTGITNTVDVKWDSVTMGYLRDTLGFDGVVVTDWWALGGGPSNPGRMTGITPEGEDLGTKDIYWLMNCALELGTDMFGSGSMMDSHENWEQSPPSNYPTALIEGLANGKVEKKNVDQAATRILRDKFEKGLFEDP